MLFAIVLIVVTGLGLWYCPTVFLTILGMVVGFVFVCKLLSSGIIATALAVIVFGTVIGAMATFNGGWPDITQDTPQAIANPPREVEAEPERTPAPAVAAPTKKTVSKASDRKTSPKPTPKSPAGGPSPSKHNEKILNRLRAM